MIRSKLLLCSETFIHDRSTNNFSAINILDQINIVAFPGFIPKLSILNVVMREPTDPDAIDLELKARIERNEIFSSPIQAEFQGLFIARIVVIIGGLVLAQPGQLTIEVFQGETLFSSYAIDISVVTEAQVVEPQ